MNCNQDLQATSIGTASVLDVPASSPKQGLSWLPFLCHIQRSASTPQISFFATFGKSGQYCLFLLTLLGYAFFNTANNFQTPLRGHASNQKAPKATRACPRIRSLPKAFLGKTLFLPCPHADSDAAVLWMRAYFPGQACSSPALQHE